MTPDWPLIISSLDKLFRLVVQIVKYLAWPALILIALNMFKVQLENLLSKAIPERVSSLKKFRGFGADLEFLDRIPAQLEENTQSDMVPKSDYNELVQKYNQQLILGLQILGAFLAQDAMGSRIHLDKIPFFMKAVEDLEQQFGGIPEALSQLRILLRGLSQNPASPQAPDNQAL